MRLRNPWGLLLHYQWDEESSEVILPERNRRGRQPGKADGGRLVELCTYRSIGKVVTLRHSVNRGLHPLKVNLPVDLLLKGIVDGAVCEERSDSRNARTDDGSEHVDLL